jgi:hypothetical protein
MTARDTDTPNAAPVRVRAMGEVGGDALAYLQSKIDAVLSRPELPAVSGEVRLAKAAARHTGHPWTAVAEIQVGTTVVVVHAREDTSQEVADRMQDLLRRQVEQVVHERDAAHRPVAPPWRGGQSGPLGRGGAEAGEGPA